MLILILYGTAVVAVPLRLYHHHYHHHLHYYVFNQPTRPAIQPGPPPPYIV